MVPKKMLKLVKSLQQKKHRYQEQLFLVEGAKSIAELLISTFTIKTIIGTAVFINQHKSLISTRLSDTNIYQTTESEISAVSSFKNNNAGIAIVEMPEPRPAPSVLSGYALVLDDIRDPGNLGTILRIADWYGISAIISSPSTTDEYSPKVISASMGSFLRVPLFRAELAPFLANTALPVYGTLVNRGKSVHNLDFADDGLILLGNESEGVGQLVSHHISHIVHIPQFGAAESLNVGVAAAIFCDNMRRSVGEKNATRI